MSIKLKNIFVSHIHEDDKGVDKLITLLKNNGLDVRNASITLDNPNNAKNADYIKQNILKPRIQWASTLVVYITPETKNSEWVEWEIECAVELGKRIVGVWGRGENQCEIPDALEKYHDSLVGWNGENIVDAIIGSTNDSYYADGTPYTKKDIDRYSCKN